MKGAAKAGGVGISVGLVVGSIEDLVYGVIRPDPVSGVTYSLGEWVDSERALIVAVIALVVGVVFSFLDRDGSGFISRRDFRPRRRNGYGAGEDENDASDAP